MKRISEKFNKRILIGWCEWCQLGELGVPAIKAKVDTGAQTSAIHAFDIAAFKKDSIDYVRFTVHPLQSNDIVTLNCVAPIIDKRYVMSSNGHKESRYVIQTPLTLADKTWNIEVTLSNRDPMRFRMLLGREALDHHTIIDSGHAMHQGKMQKSFLKELYTIPEE